MTLKEPTDELKVWYDRWFKANASDFPQWFSSEDIIKISKLGEGFRVSERFDLSVTDQLTFDRLHYGTLTSPKFQLKTLISDHLLSIFPKYSDVVTALALLE